MPAKTTTLKALKTKSSGIQTQTVPASMAPTNGGANLNAGGASGCGCSNGGTCVGCDGRCKCKTLFGCHFLGVLKQKKALAAIPAAFLILWAVQFITHGNLLMPIYNQTPELWLPTDQMSLPAILLGNLGLSIIATILFYLAQKFGTYWEGLRLGKLIFAPLAIAVAYQWATRPTPDIIAFAWAAEYLVEGMLIGLVLTAFGKCHCLSGKWFGSCGKSKGHHHHGAGCC